MKDLTPSETETLKMFDEEIESLFKRGNEAVCVETREETVMARMG